MGVDVKWLMKSPFGAQLRTEAKPALAELQGLESLLDQVDSVYISVVSKAPAKGAKAAGKANNSDLVVLVKGKFSFDKLTELAVRNGMKPEQWGKTKVLVPVAAKGKTKMQKVQFTQLPMDVTKATPVFALFDETKILIAEEAPLRVALERMESGLTPQANPLFERARDLEAANDFWIVGSTAPLNLAGAAKPGAPKDPMTQMMEQVRNFSVGVAVRRNVTMDLQLQTTSPKVATQMNDMARGLLALAKASQKPGEELPINLDEALQLSASGNIMRASLTIEQQELDKLIAQTMQKAVPGLATGGQAPQVAAAPTPAAPAPEAAPKPVVPQRKTVMIYGLPGGPKEVPVDN
jgi:hypothetical protein